LSEALVVSFRWSALQEPSKAIEHALEAVREAREVGAKLAAFSGFEVAFRFEPGEVEAAAFFARTIVQQIPALGRAGIARGGLATFTPADGVELAWGEPVVVAAALARLAELGTVLISAELGSMHEDILSFSGAGRELAFGGKSRPTLRLMPLSFAEEAELPDNLTETTQVAAASSFRPPPRRQQTGSYDLLELARTALLRSDLVPLDTAVSELNISTQDKEVVERLAGVLATTRGANEEGLRVLRRAADLEQSDDRRARALLAYAIGVAAAGRHEESLLEALLALALTRRIGDASGERACARFLAQLSFTNGHQDAASAWEHVAKRTISVAPSGGG
jgi:hypothetical protein